ncbi:hypothetical protein ACWD6R_17325 [Streptomyces sp. NPDC005151]
MNILDVRDLGIRTADGRTLVDGLSLTIAPGERLGLLGLARATSGTVRFDGSRSRA